MFFCCGGTTVGFVSGASLSEFTTELTKVCKWCKVCKRCEDRLPVSQLPNILGFKKINVFPEFTNAANWTEFANGAKISRLYEQRIYI